MLKALGLLLLVLAVLYLAFANPWNWFVPHSSEFTWNRFAEIDVGEDLASAVSKLGKPVSVVPYHGLQMKCPNCTIVFFAGPPPEWLPSYREARLVVDPSGTIVNVRIHEEP
jgi:hypothetical protein